MSEITSSSEYTFDAIRHIRLRPGMYLSGGTDLWAMHYLLDEVINNGVDQAQLGNCTHLRIVLQSENTVTVRDEGPGIPIAIYEDSGRSILELIFTKGYGKFDARTQKFISTLFGVGLPVVNALSALLQVQVARDGFLWQQEYRSGKPQSPLKQVRPLAVGESTGTTITFTPDFTVFEPNVFQFSLVEERCRDLAYLADGLSIILRDERFDPIQEMTFYSEKGLLDCIDYLRGSNSPVHQSIQIKHDIEFKQRFERTSIIQIELAAQYVTTALPVEESFASRFKLRRGQSYMYWLQSAFLDFMNKYSYERGLLVKGDSPLTRQEGLAGLITVVNISNLYPQQPFQGKCDLPYHELREILYDLARDALETFTKQQPQQMDIIADWLISRRYDAQLL
jgi:DNA gyrase subunit B